MTTNHRPTLESKRGRDIAIKNTIQHSRSIKNHSSLKLRSDISGATIDSTSAKRALEEIQQPEKKQKKQLPDGESETETKEPAAAHADESANEEPSPESSKEASSESESESDDDTDELLAELQKIKDDKAKEVLSRNPLIAADGTDTIPQRKSWRSAPAFGRAKAPAKPAYTTDKLQSDTHKQFLSKYIH